LAEASKEMTTGEVEAARGRLEALVNTLIAEDQGSCRSSITENVGA
jgi:hypothetical protein